MALLSSKSFDSINAQVRRQKGPLVNVEVSPGRFVKMYRDDAIAAGHIDPPAPQRGEKSRLAAENKMLPPAEDKIRRPVEGKGEEPDDLTVISGVGPATVRALKAHGISTFEALRAAGQLDFVSPSAMAAIEQWRQGSGPD